MPNATVRANARGLSKARPSLSRSKTRRPVRAKKRTPVKKAAPDAAARLSFVASRDGITLPLATERQDPRCFWHVKPTGDYAADCVTGEKLAPEFLEYEAKHWGGGQLQHIVKDMPRRRSRRRRRQLTQTDIAIGSASGIPNRA
jgi:hypothetical protein